MEQRAPANMSQEQKKEIIRVWKMIQANHPEQDLSVHINAAEEMYGGSQREPELHITNIDF
jgi:hypothetical protein